MADARFVAKVDGDLSGLKKAAGEAQNLFKKFAPTGLKTEYEKTGKAIGDMLGKSAPKGASAKVAIGAALVKEIKTAETAFNGLVRNLGDKLGYAFGRALTPAEKLRRTIADTSADKTKRSLENAAKEIPKISTALFKVDEAWKKISVEAELQRKKLKDQAAYIGTLKQNVANLRKEYDARAEVAKTEAAVKKLGQTRKQLDEAERTLKAAVKKSEEDIKKKESERVAVLTSVNAQVSKGLASLKLTVEEEKKLSVSEKLRLVTQKQLTEEQNRQAKIAKDQSQIDAARRQAYALTIAGGQLKNYGDQMNQLSMQSAEAFGNIDYQIRRAAAATGANASMVGELTTAAKRASEQMGYFSSEEIAKGMYFFASTTGAAVNSTSDLSDMMSELIPIMQAAAITSSDMEGTIKGVYGVLNQFGLPMENASSVTEMLYYAAQKTAAELPDFVESLKMLGPVAAQAGVSFEETLQALALLADNGIRGTMAGRAVRQMFLQLNDPANRATEALDNAVKSQLGLNKSFKELVFPKGEFIGMSGYMRTLAKVTANMNDEQRGNILGIIATAAEVPALTKLIEDEVEAMRNGTSALKDNTKGVGDAAAASILFADSLELVGASTKANLGRISTSITNIKATMGEALAPAIERLSVVLADAAEKFDNFAKANPELVKTIANFAVLGGVVATVGGALLAFFGAFRLVTKVAFAELSLIARGGKSVTAALTGGTEAAAATAAAAGTAAKEVAGVSKSAGFLSGIFGGLKAKVGAPFAAIKAGGGAGAKILGVLGKLGGFLGGIFRVLGLKVQAIITVFAGLFTGIFQGLNAGKGETDALGGAMSVLGTVLEGVGKVVEILSAAFGFLFEVARSVGIFIGSLFAEGGPLKGAADVIGGAFGLVGDVLGNIGGFIGDVTDNLRQMNDDALNPQGKRLREIDAEVARLKAGYGAMSESVKDDTRERIRLLELERQKILGLTNATTNAFVNSQAFIDFRKGEREGLSDSAFADILSKIKSGAYNPTPTPTPTGTGTGDAGKSAAEKALELAQQAASLAEALFKIEGLDLKALVKRTMGKVAEAMKLAIQYSKPYAKAFSAKTLTVVGNFADAVGKVASAIGGMVDAAEKIATYKAPTPAAMKKIVADMSLAMKYMIAEAKKFAGSSVVQVQLFADSATAVVGSIGAAVDAFNSMAKGVYTPPGTVLMQIANDISKAVAAFVAQLASAPTQPMLDKAQAFATAADAVLGTIGNAIGAFKDLRKYVRPLPDDLQAVVDTIEMAIQKMLVSMGRFSLNKEQLDVVGSFASVAKLIADAVGGTYDAFVKQMDFVDQFRTTIDYDQVFGWIEMGIRKMSDIAGAMPVGMVDMAKDAAEAAQAIAGALEAFFNLAVNTGGDPALLADSLQVAVNSVLSVIEAFASTTQFVGAQFVDSLIVGMQSRESALAAEAARLTEIMGSAGGTSMMRSSNNTMTINHVVTDPNGVLKNASAQEVANLLSGDVFISNLQHSIKTQ
jgi:TP901 family phage tail tape measure protein